MIKLNINDKIIILMIIITIFDNSTNHTHSMFDLIVGDLRAALRRLPEAQPTPLPGHLVLLAFARPDDNVSDSSRDRHNINMNNNK